MTTVMRPTTAAPSRLVLFLLICSSVLFIGDRLRLLDGVKAPVETLTIPVRGGLVKLGQRITTEIGQIVNLRSLHQANLALKAQNNQLRAELTRYRGVLEENNLLKKQFEKLSPRTFNLLPAQVIGWGDTLIIDQGERAGVKVDQSVVVGDYFIGQIIKVTPGTAQVRTVFHPQSKIAVLVRQARAPSQLAPGVLMGKFGSSLHLEQVLHKQTLLVGDVVVTSGEEHIAKGLVIGEIEQLIKEEAEIFQKAQVRALFDVATLPMVFVSIEY